MSTRLFDLAKTIRSKNAGVDRITFDVIFSDPANYAQGLTFSNVQPVYFEKHIGAKDRLGADGYRGTVFHDVDGSVTGNPDASVVLDTPLLAETDCSARPAWNALICQASYGSLFIIGVD